ncbi:MAG: hypothetical protein IH932_03375 [Thaumarchaeota archaeon]|nr:hypothetical protein [Nitrososphaerota archaeon]
MSKSKQKITAAGDLLRRGATLLMEPCEKCGGLQFQYQGKTICLNCGDLSDPGSTKTVTEGPVQVDPLASFVKVKLEKVSLLLKAEEDIDKQIKLSDLILKYIEILSKVSVVKKS